MALALGDVLALLARRWGREREYLVRALRDRWSDVSPEPWAKEIRAERIDEDGRLVVSIPGSASVRMEVQRRGQRWRDLLDGCRRVAGCDLTDLVVDEPRRRARTKKKG